MKEKSLQNAVDKGSAYVKTAIEFVVFNSKWLLVPFYLKLIYTLLTMAVHFCFHGEIEPDEILHALHDVDITMVANLVKMIITGSYNSFVDKNHKDKSEKISSSALKVKMSTSLVGVSSMFLLRVLLSIQLYDWVQTQRQIIIHLVFLIGSLMLAVIEYLHCRSEFLMAETEKIEHSLGHKSEDKNEH
jgi:uncharacterized protein (TIGR00645 family)